MAATYVSLAKAGNTYSSIALPLYTCTSNHAASDKFITVNNLTASDIVAGLMIRIDFSPNGNTDSSPYLTIKNASNVVISNSKEIVGFCPKTPESFNQTDNTIMTLCYDGTKWIIM